MGYAKIPNLYKDKTILMFKECYALEKIHGTSAHIKWDGKKILFLCNGYGNEKFMELFDIYGLCERLVGMNIDSCSIFGEVYGGGMNSGRVRYGEDVKFIAFDVKIGDCWLKVPDAEGFSNSLGLEFVHYEKMSANVSRLDKARDRKSRQAERNGMGTDKKAEGIVIRPLIEMTTNAGYRICAKHKRDDFCERKTKQPVSEERLKILEDAEAIAEEWVTLNRLNNILSHIEKEPELSDIPDIIKLMINDIEVEAKDEIIESREARKAIGKRAAKLFKDKVTSLTRDSIREVMESDNDNNK